jgi:hypothetical protein
VLNKTSTLAKSAKNRGKIMNKNLIVLSMLTMMLFSGIFMSFVAAQEDEVDPTTRAVDPSEIPDAGLIAPTPDDNTTSSTGDETLYHIMDDNRTAVDDTQVPGAEDADLIAINTSTNPDNTLSVAAVGVLSVVVAVAAVGGVYHRRIASKQQI